MTSTKNSLPRPAWLSERVWPFETFGLKVDDSVLAVTDVGRGPALLFVHTGAWSFIWRDVMLRLAGDFRCICFDAPGNGRTSPLRQSKITLEGAARAVTGVIEKLDLNDLTLVVHDLGGIAGLAGAGRTPTRVSAIAAVNAFAWRPSGSAFRGMLALMGSTFMREFDVLTGFLPRISATSFGVGRHLDDASRHAFVSGMGTGGRRAFHNYLRDARRCDALYGEIARTLAGPFAGLPLLTVFGERNDPFGFQRRWKGLFPDAVQVVVKKGNHFPMCDDPDLLANSIREWHLSSEPAHRL